MDIQDAEMLAFLHMEDHGLFDDLWHFDFEYCKRSLGRCHYSLRKITLSKWYVKLNEEDDVEDTILHEIAHALGFIRYGREGQGTLWKTICREIGASPERTHKGILEYPNNHYKYSDDCICGITHERHRISTNRKYHCSKCNQPVFSKKAKAEWLASKRILDQILECA